MKLAFQLGVTVRLIIVIVLLFFVSACENATWTNSRSELVQLQANFPNANEEISREALVFCVLHPAWWSSSKITIEFELHGTCPNTSSTPALVSDRLTAGYCGFRQRPDLPVDVFIEINAGTTTWVVSEKLPCGKYWWRARAVGHNVVNTWIPAIPVMVVQTSAAIIVSPDHESMTCSLVGPLIIEAPSGFSPETTCEYEVSTDPGFLDVLFLAENIVPGEDTILSIELDRELPDRFSIWWRARIRNSNGMGPWSKPSRFYTERLTPPIAVIPAPGGTSRGLQPELVVINSSLECPSQPSYEFQVARDVFFSELVFSEIVEQGEFELTSFKIPFYCSEGETFYWRCRAISEPLIGRWSNTAHFSISPLASLPSSFADAVAYCGVTCLNSVRYQDCNEALGSPDASATSNPDSQGGFDYDGFVSLGIRGSIILDMGEGAEIINGSGPDLVIWQAVSVEQFQVFVAETASGPYIDLGIAGNGWFQRDNPYFVQSLPPTGPFFRGNAACYTTTGDGGYSGQLGWCDIAETGLTTVRFVRIVDMQPWGDLRKDCTWFDYWYTGEWLADESAGADIDAVMARYTSSSQFSLY